MARQTTHPLTLDEPLHCRICAEGEVSRASVAFWDCLRVVCAVCDDGSAKSVLSGALPDQSALLGLVNHLYNLGYPIRSLECHPASVPAEQATAAPPVPDDIGGSER